MSRKLTIVAYLGAVASFALAVLLYRGGNLANDGLAFQWSANFISDLGLTTTHGLVRGLFVAAMLLTGLAVSGAVNRQSQPATIFKFPVVILAIVLTVLGMTVALVPSDIYHLWHRYSFVLLLLTSAVLWTILATKLQLKPGAQRLVTVLTSLILWAYLIFIFIAPRPETSLRLSMIHSQVEKGVFIIFLASLAVLIFNSPKRLSRL